MRGLVNPLPTSRTARGWPAGNEATGRFKRSSITGTGGRKQIQPNMLVRARTKKRSVQAHLLPLLLLHGVTRLSKCGVRWRGHRGAAGHAVQV